MKRLRFRNWQWVAATFAVVFGTAIAPVHETVEDSRAVYWFFSLSDGDEIQFHGSALTEAITIGEFLASVSAEGGGTLYIVVEGSTGWFLDTPAPADAPAPAGEIVMESAEAAVAAAPAENVKMRTVDVMRIWAHDDDFNDVADWTLHSVDLIGQSTDAGYIVQIEYESVEVGNTD